MATTVEGFRLDGPDDIPVRDAATVMLLRDGEGGLEVCMQQRNLNSDFVGGAYVFPGGAVDPGDNDPAVAARCRGRIPAEADRLLDLPEGSGGLGFWVAAIREAFEESGVLLASRAEDADGVALSFEDPDVAARFEEHRRAVDAGERTLVEVCDAEGVVLDCGGLHYFSRWITPVGAPRRYDTRFFVAAAPPQQVAVHDDREVIGTHWLTPADALARHDAGEIVLIFPTVRSLVALRRFERAGEVLAHAASLARIPAVLPTVSDTGGGMRIILPGDPEHTGGTYDAVTGHPVSDD
jgi:8-oxo-dGTP pyrophosphatase MutT (NUDIX family)